MKMLIVALDRVTPVNVPDAEVLVVAPALNSRLRHWLSDVDAARRHAEERVAAWVDRLREDGVQAQGRVGDTDPLQAIADTLATFAADEVVIVAQSDRPSRLADELVSRVRSRFGLPVHRAGSEIPRAVYTAPTSPTGVATAPCL